MSRIPQPWQRKSTGAWFVQLDGKKVYLGKNKRQAFVKYHNIMQRRQAPTTYTVNQIINQFIAWQTVNRAKSTAEVREPILRAFADFLPGNLKADAIKPLHVQEWVDGQKWNSSTTNHRISLVIGVFSWAKRMGYIDENPLAGMPKPRRKIRQDFVPVDLWPKLIGLARDGEFGYFLTVMLSTGARVQEMFKFEAKHFNGHSLVLPIEDSKGHKSSRVVFLPKEALSIVAYLCVENPEGPLFRNPKGKPWNRNMIRLRFRRLKRELKMPWLTATHLRHSFAHHRLSSGQDALTVSKLMGHTDTRMLATRYGHLDANTQFMLDAANAAPFPGQ